MAPLRTARRLQSIAKLWAATSAPTIPAAVAAIFEIDVAMARETLRKAAEVPLTARPLDQS